MIGFKHLIITLVMVFGLLLGNVLIDLDHRGSFKTLWLKFWKDEPSVVLHKGILHNPIIMLSIMGFSFCLALGMMFHLIMDFVFK